MLVPALRFGASGCLGRQTPKLARTFTSSLSAAVPLRTLGLRLSAPMKSTAAGPLRTGFKSTASPFTLVGFKSTASPFTLVGSIRTYAQPRVVPTTATTIPIQPSRLRKLLTAGAIFGGSLIAINLVFNREGRDDGGMPIYEREYLNDTFLHTGLGIGIIGLTARQLIRTNYVYRAMMTNPWVFGLGGLALSFATMIAARSIEPENYVPKYAAWAAFNVVQAGLIAPMLAFYPAAIIARAGLYTVAMMGGLSIVGATAKQDKYLYLGGPLLAGACVILASGLAPLVIPATALRTLAVTESLWLYGGLALFGAFTLYDVQKVMQRARMAERGLVKRDPIASSIALELDFLNIFIRMVQILGNGGQRKH